MNPTHPLLLPRKDRLLLQSAVWMVPPADRADWLRSWHAELWHRRYPRSGGLQTAIDLYPGLVCDSLWMRTHAWCKALHGTALLCILLLGLLLFASVLPLAAILGSAGALLAFIPQRLVLFFCEAVPVTIVSFVTSSRTIKYESGLRSGPGHRLFHLTKLLLVLMIAFACSQDATVPIYGAHRFTAEIVQPQLFALLALLALRWNFQDHENRCKHCLRLLAAPARVGRPSWNFLDSNGTELLCREGHGLLSIPEIETSWRRSSRWIAT